MTRARDLAAFVSNADGDIKFDTDTLFIDSSANRVGIGTDAPVAPLDIDADSTATNMSFRSRTGTDFANVNFRSEDGTTTLANIGSVGDEFRISTGGSSTLAERMRIDDSGNVGINNTSPNTKLDIIGSSTNGSGVVDTLRLRNTGTTLNDGSRLQFTSGTSTSGAAIGSQGKALNSADLLFYAGGNSERMRILAGGGLTFNGDTAAANALDDYEEGTWTPTLEYNSSGATNPTISSTSNFTYVKVGQMVLITGYISISSSAKGSGSNLRITGLPFTGNANYNMSPIWTASAGSPYGAYISGSDNAINFGLLEGSSGGANSTNCPNEISVQMVYRTGS
jgi:hypothetical protein